VATLSLGGKEVARASSRVNGGRFDNNATIFYEFLDVSTRIGIANFSLFGGIEPDFAFANTSDAGSKSLLRPEIYYGEVIIRDCWSKFFEDEPISLLVK
jgi:hypothetical protein